MLIGPHVILPSDAALRWAARAPIVKALDDTRALEAAPAEAIRVFRHYLPEQNLEDPVGTANAVLAALNGYRHPKLYVEFWNEAHPNTDQLAAAVQVCHAAGVKVAGGSWGTGDYTESDVETARQAGVDLISAHAYWGNQGFTPWHALRYRTYAKPGDKWALTEIGRDAVEGGAAGWQKSGVSVAQYLAELLAYDAEISKDSYVLGATVFTAGPTPDWDAFSTDSFSDQILSALGAGDVVEQQTQAQPTVGEGIANKMAEQGDQPRSDEHYIGDFMSVAFGDKGLYVYSKEANRTFFLAAR